MNKRILALICMMVMAIAVFTACAKESDDAQTIATTTDPTETLMSGVVENIFYQEESTVNETVAAENQEKVMTQQETTPEETTEVENVTNGTVTIVTVPDVNDSEDSADVTDYEIYKSMTPDEQVEFYESFGSPEEYLEWFTNAKAEYDAKQNVVEIGPDGAIVEIIE